jgi:hypothetical protein
VEKPAEKKMERAKGFEPSASNSQQTENQRVAEYSDTAYIQIRAQIQGNDGRDLAQVVASWPGLPAAFKAAILAIVGSNEKEGR